MGVTAVTAATGAVMSRSRHSNNSSSRLTRSKSSGNQDLSAGPTSIPISQANLHGSKWFLGRMALLFGAPAQGMSLASTST